MKRSLALFSLIGLLALLLPAAGVCAETQSSGASQDTSPAASRPEALPAAEGPALGGALDPAAQAASPSAEASQPAPEAQTPEAPAARKPGFFAWWASPASFDLGMGILGIVNLDQDENGGVGRTSSTMSFPGTVSLGLEYPLTKNGFLGFEPGLEAYQLYYGLDFYGTTKGVKATPMMDASRRDAWTMGLLVELPLTFNLGLGSLGRLSLGLGPAFNLRYGIQAAPNIYDMATKDDDAAAMAAINSYFWADGRWFTPSTFLRFQYKVNERLALDIKARAYWPVFNFWTSEGFGFWDEMVGSLTVAAAFLR